MDVVVAPEKPVEPYSVFDRRQKRLITLVVTTVATCKLPISTAWWYRIEAYESSVYVGIEHLLPRDSHHC